jgi:hypothetical protein
VQQLRCYYLLAAPQATAIVVIFFWSLSFFKGFYSNYIR